MKELIIIGCGGHAASCVEVATSASLHIHGIVGMPHEVGKKVCNYQVKYTDSDIPNLIEGFDFLIGIGQIKSPEIRKKTFEFLVKMGASLPIIRASSSILSSYSRIEQGVILMHGSIVNSQAKIGANTIINTGSIIEHDSTIGSHCHVSTRVVINGGCQVGNEVFLGSACIIKEGVSIGDGCIVGAGSVVIRDLPPGTIAMGTPAKGIRLK